MRVDGSTFALRVLCVAVLLLSVGCSGGSSNDLTLGDPPDLIFGERRLDVAVVAGEFARIRDEFVDAEHQFAECVRSLGYAYEPRRVEASFPATEQFPTVAESYKTHGYGIVDGEGNTGSVVTISGGYVPIGEQEDFAANVFTKNEGDCLRFYYQQDIQETLYLLRVAETQPSERTLADPRFAEAELAWSKCMAESGFTFSSRHEPFNFIEQQLAAIDKGADDYAESMETLRAEEIRVATTDIECHLTRIEPVVAALEELHNE